jgi:hypothetical protein
MFWNQDFKKWSNRPFEPRISLRPSVAIVKTTEIYTHVMEKKLNEIVSPLELLFRYLPNSDIGRIVKNGDALANLPIFVNYSGLIRSFVR